jgi:ADP-ribose pyrophosphatase YjhB (NUDIX family)
MITPLDPAFCPSCGGGLLHRFVPEEERERLVCAGCGAIHYVNPKVVAGTIPVADGRVWLLRRAIEPRLGWWTFPAGFMEMGESVEEAAVRETLEELNLEVRLTGLLNVYSLPTMTTVHIIYRAEALSQPSLGKEALELASFPPEEVPWDDLAFWSTRAALEDWVRSLDR